jgi:hypothetical protein
LSSNGKIDLSALLSPEDSAQPVNTYVAPRNENEQMLAGIWPEILILNQFGIEDDFFSLGMIRLSVTRAFA